MIEGVTPVVVTRGDVKLGAVLDPLAAAFRERVIVWNNAADNRVDISVLGRYAGAMLAPTSLVYVQDDDVVVHDPAAIVDAYDGSGSVVCNMPAEFRHDGYREHALVGFGGVFHRLDAARAISRFAASQVGTGFDFGWICRVCDIPVTALLRRVLVDVPRTNMPYASEPNRMWKQPSHISERQRALEIALTLRTEER